ncbi:MAG: hypothetical protein NXI20_16465 [bacterium]|nr:hypothetical protein [bacterium]
MKRIHLFEFEDQAWFPNWIRELMTRYIETFHKLLGTSDQLIEILKEPLKSHGDLKLYDLCSGAGGPMIEVQKKLKIADGYENTKLTLSDLYPNGDAINIINNNGDESVVYETSSVDATNVKMEGKALRTMICSLHHMKPEIAKGILKNAKDQKQAFCAYEISDNSFPKWIWWIAIPFSFLTVFFVTPMVRPMTFKQLFFTYVIPVLPFFIAWDGAVSNARTYTLEDMDILLEDLSDESYTWEKGSLKGKGGNKLYLLGTPA